VAPAAEVTRVIAPPGFQLRSNEGTIPSTLILVALFGHLILGALMEYSSTFGYIHMIGTLVIGFAWASSRDFVVRSAYIAGYITGSEVLWRMLNISLLWELGKYSACAVMLLALVRKGRCKPHVASAIYFLLLVPSAVITYSTLGFKVGRQPISFNLSGPFAIAVAVWFFWNVQMSTEQLRRLFLFVILPCTAVGGATLYAVMTASALRFTANSNMATSAGYGPNQVSAILGLGALFVLFYLIQGGTPSLLRAALFACAVFLAIQSAMTFSRGGLAASAASFLIASLFLLRDRKFSSRIGPLLGVGALAAMVVFPRLESLTGGALGRRFQDPNTTHRDQIVRAELELWSQHPIFGVGVGMGGAARHAAGRGVSGVAHTEFTRALAEHGSFGFIAILVLIAMPIAHLRDVQGALPKAMIAGCCCWAFLFMAFNDMRLMAPAFIYGLGFLNLAPARQMFRLRSFPWQSAAAAI